MARAINRFVTQVDDQVYDWMKSVFRPDMTRVEARAMLRHLRTAGYRIRAMGDPARPVFAAYDAEGVARSPAAVRQGLRATPAYMTRSATDAGLNPAAPANIKPAQGSDNIFGRISQGRTSGKPTVTSSGPRMIVTPEDVVPLGTNPQAPIQPTAGPARYGVRPAGSGPYQSPYSIKPYEPRPFTTLNVRPFGPPPGPTSLKVRPLGTGPAPTGPTVAQAAPGTSGATLRPVGSGVGAGARGMFNPSTLMRALLNPRNVAGGAAGLAGGVATGVAVDQMDKAMVGAAEKIPQTRFLLDLMRSMGAEPDRRPPERVAEPPTEQEILQAEMDVRVRRYERLRAQELAAREAEYNEILANRESQPPMPSAADVSRQMQAEMNPVHTVPESPYPVVSPPAPPPILEVSANSPPPPPPDDNDIRRFRNSIIELLKRVNYKPPPPSPLQPMGPEQSVYRMLDPRERTAEMLVPSSVSTDYYQRGVPRYR